MSTIGGSRFLGTNGPGSPERRDSVVGVTPARVLTSELIKLRGLRSTVWAMVTIAVAIAAGGVFAAVGIVVKDTPSARDAVALDPSGGALSGVGLAQLAAIALGILAVTTEYQHSAIRTSLTAVPSRLPLIWAKAVVVTVVTAAVSLTTLAVTLLVADAVIGIDGASISLTTPGLVRATLGSALALAMVAVLASGVGWLLRSTAGAVSVMLAVLYILPILTALLPPVAPYLPSTAASAITQVRPIPDLLPPWAGLAVLSGYAALALAAAAFSLRRRDA